ncbi:MAG: lysophospholipid acyltransferase family protein [Spirochaetia bacterium]|jgi:1-acyl-sn-glycerol-3-phosphate acyltransferase
MAYRKGANIIGFTPPFPPFIILYHLVVALVRIFDWCVYRVRITGRENLPRTGGAILVSNHTLLLDPGILAHALRPRRTYFTMLEETALIPFLGTFVRLLGGVPIPERPGALRALDRAARTALRELGFIHFFPEGECYRENQVIQAFHPGAFLLACRLNVPLVPITTVLHETRWRGRRSFRVAGKDILLPPRVTIVIGAPVPVPLTLLPAAGQGEDGASLKRAAKNLSEQVRAGMQATIDRERGSKTMYRGIMPRLVKHPPREQADVPRPLGDERAVKAI